MACREIVDVRFLGCRECAPVGYVEYRLGCKNVFCVMVSVYVCK